MSAAVLGQRAAFPSRGRARASLGNRGVRRHGAYADSSRAASARSAKRELAWLVLAALSLAIAAGSCGHARVTPLLETSCDNGLDDDADAMADCRDPDCAPNPLCAGRH